MDTSVPSVSERRVHAVPLGYERDRIVEPLRRHGADVAYLLVDVPDRDGERGDVDFAAATASDPADSLVDPNELTDYQRDAWTAVAEFAAVRPIPVALADVYDVLGATTTVAARHRAGAEDGDRLFGNVSTGPRVAAVGVAMACMIVGARPYSVEPERHRHDPREEPLTEGVERTADLPIYPMDAPTSDQVAILGRLHDRTEGNLTTDKWNLIEWARERELSFLREAGESRTAKYRALETHVLSPLRERGYVELEDVGRSDTVRITETGRRVFFAFKHKLDER
ncbi:hypothetical protein EKH57_11695 [Halorubrum sp. BOL3-1]|uniref:HFX_2341 family transcriptional regulator domain-containing protein n=1 Tax=Halorubrum sp. BOL3-1 TaxID=2497325 RepID=UPI001004D8C2|nr:DUF6293 family protein [Halorubrum sp. BOL3-1]QAU13327.1 hypothetical protein EKH57_11695 [Halorubrum sp. BOL3-1]